MNDEKACVNFYLYIFMLVGAKSSQIIIRIRDSY